MSRLPATETAGDGIPVVFLHGFGGDRHHWKRIADRVPGPTIAFDLPGHGEAVEWPDRTFLATARNAVLHEFDVRELDRVHLVGHSRGGALACLVAMKAPERIASLTLIAPGGFGHEIAAAQLEAFAIAASREAVHEVLCRLYAPQRPTSRAVDAIYESRTGPALHALATIAATLSDHGRQNRLDLTRIDTAIPTAIVWGTEDAVLPVSQAGAMGDRATVTRVEGAGHMLHLTHPDTVADTLLTMIDAK